MYGRKGLDTDDVSLESQIASCASRQYIRTPTVPNGLASRGEAPGRPIWRWSLAEHPLDSELSGERGSTNVPISAFFSSRQKLYVDVVKRVFDVIVSSLLLLAIALPMLAFAIWIVLDSPGSAFYSQRRVGWGQREFTMYKFRSMVIDAHFILERSPELAAEHAVHWKIIRDPRVTRCGSFIRKFSIDELPQLLNVLKGDMSLIGPRPYLPNELAGEFGRHADHITSVKPGMTGLWQVTGRSRLGPGERIALDEQYARTYSAKLDLSILLKTIKVVIMRHGAW